MEEHLESAKPKLKRKFCQSHTNFLDIHTEYKLICFDESVVHAMYSGI